ncbi:hypothetical protein GPECTOR_84g323 [Gonium pectorale]|uniref:Right handed beta helix domain-containing protein n=1 Tax=Gonium pectorale TaxID=33097 RepID=A0A150G1D2_GONPE|nr:hypothetical protein GPECTOR_84g323 [Gonium pectorale]|eukprot:KXZ43647.1 hypothetical protein GPECTOR_84g323 [Gonium pectorale]
MPLTPLCVLRPALLQAVPSLEREGRGAVYINGDVGGELSVDGSSTMSGNRADGGAGGAIYIWNSVENITVDGNSTISANVAKWGGAIYIGYLVTTSLTVGGSSTISGNRADGGNGGAVYVGANVGNLTIDGSSTVSGNRANGGDGETLASVR